MVEQITPKDRRYPVAQGWMLGVLERLLSNTRGADFEIASLIRRVKENKIVWLGALPCRDWTKRRRA